MNRIQKLYHFLFSFWIRFPEKLRFLLVGGYNTVISYLLYALFLWIGDERYPQLSLFFSFILSSLNSYWTQKIFVFVTSGNYMREYIRCLLSWGISYLLNVVWLYILVHIVLLNPYLAQLIAQILVVVNSYLMLKHFAFKSINKE